MRMVKFSAFASSISFSECDHMYFRSGTYFSYSKIGSYFGFSCMPVSNNFNIEFSEYSFLKFSYNWSRKE